MQNGVSAMPTFHGYNKEGQRVTEVRGGNVKALQDFCERNKSASFQGAGQTLGGKTDNPRLRPLRALTMSPLGGHQLDRVMTEALLQAQAVQQQALPHKLQVSSRHPLVFQMGSQPPRCKSD